MKNKVFRFVLSLFVLLVMAPKVYAVDLVVNGETKSVPGGQFNNVFVANYGTLTINGKLDASVK